MNAKLWSRANLELVSKSIAELLYEEVLTIFELDGTFYVHLKSDIYYAFKGKKGKWDFFQITPSSLTRIPSQGDIDAATFFQDANLDLEMTQITLAHFIEEMNNTLFSEMQVLRNQQGITVEEMADLSGEDLQPYLSGHPKLLLNKGRIGFSASDLKKYSPEHAQAFRPFWLAVKKTHLLSAGIAPSLKEADRHLAAHLIKETNASIDEYDLIPTHPWQFERYIQVQFQREIANNTIIPLKELGAFYKPQIAIRTLSNTDKKNEPDLKLSLTILNTSAYRGISSHNIEMGPALSEFIENICSGDPILATTQVLKEIYVASFAHPTFSQIEGSPYRYNELLGCVMRENASSKLMENELAVMTGSLFYSDGNDSLIGEYISRSKLSAAEWMRHYFNHVVIPLYHLQLKYGIGIVSHGQNIVLKMRDFIPAGLFIKDFQGDLRVSEDFIDLFPAHLQKLKYLPAPHLIHDLITGHFVTVLRFISPVLDKCGLLTENDFYHILGHEIKAYIETHQPDLLLTNPLHLLRPEFEKIILNKVRFKIGYEDSAARPLPILGKNLQNPMTINQGDLYAP